MTVVGGEGLTSSLLLGAGGALSCLSKIEWLLGGKLATFEIIFCSDFSIATGRIFTNVFGAGSSWVVVSSMASNTADELTVEIL